MNMASWPAGLLRQRGCTLWWLSLLGAVAVQFARPREVTGNEPVNSAACLRVSGPFVAANPLCSKRQAASETYSWRL